MSLPKLSGRPFILVYVMVKFSKLVNLPISSGTKLRLLHQSILKYFKLVMPVISFGTCFITLFLDKSRFLRFFKFISVEGNSGISL